MLTAVQIIDLGMGGDICDRRSDWMGKSGVEVAVTVETPLPKSKDPTGGSASKPHWHFPRRAGLTDH